MKSIFLFVANACKVKHMYFPGTDCFIHSMSSSHFLTSANENMEDNYSWSWRNSRVIWLLAVTAPKRFCNNRCACLPLSVSRCQALCWSRCPLPVGVWGVLATWAEWQDSQVVCYLHSCPPSKLPCSAVSTHLTSNFSWWEVAQCNSESNHFLSSNTGLLECKKGSF